jgi:hypothetical protein
VRLTISETREIDACFNIVSPKCEGWVRIVSQNLLLPSVPHPSQGKKKMTQNTALGYPRAESILALAGGAIMALSGVLFLAASTFVLPNLSYSNLSTPPNLSPGSLPTLISGMVGVMGAFGLVSGAVVLASATMLLAKVGQRRTWGILILVFSILSFIGLGGFIVGAILGILGGIMTLRWKPPTI